MAGSAYMANIPQAIEKQTFILLQELMGDKDLAEIIGLFRTDSQQSIQQLGKAIHTRQATVISGICHNLKSSCRLLGAMQLASLVADLEDFPVETNQQQAIQLQQQIEAEFIRVIQWLDQQTLSQRTVA